FIVAEVDTGAHIAEFATPAATEGSKYTSGCMFGPDMSCEYHSSATSMALRPARATYFGFVRSTRRPTNGAATPEMIALGASSSAACAAFNPSTNCMKNISGNDIAVTEKPMSAMVRFASEKLRSRNSDSGTRG